MKKLFFVLSLFFISVSKVHAVQTPIWISSNVATNISTSTLCGQAYVINGTTTNLRGILHGVCVNTAAAGNVQVFASTFTNVGTITGLYSTATQIPCNFYDAASTNGLVYNKNGTADVTILYQCY